MLHALYARVPLLPMMTYAAHTPHAYISFSFPISVYDMLITRMICLYRAGGRGVDGSNRLAGDGTSLINGAGKNGTLIRSVRCMWECLEPGEGEYYVSVRRTNYNYNVFISYR